MRRILINASGTLKLKTESTPKNQQIKIAAVPISIRIGLPAHPGWIAPNYPRNQMMRSKYSATVNAEMVQNTYRTVFCFTINK